MSVKVKLQDQNTEVAEKGDLFKGKPLKHGVGEFSAA